MSDKFGEPLTLTDFGPLDDDEKQLSVGQYISNFFSKFTRSSSNVDNSSTTSTLESPDESQNNVLNHNDPSASIDPGASSSGTSVALAEGRSVLNPNVLKRISNLLALKNTNLQAYSDTELRQYWMPDSVAKECFECSEKFTTWRRRHHCRLCGQIFCSRCCSQEIPGKLMGCTGDLRVCMYCCKIVLSYLPASNIGADMSADIRSILENLQSKYGTTNISGNSDITSIASSATNSLGSSTNLNSLGTESEVSTVRRKISVGYQEEKFAIGRRINKNAAISEERCRALQSSTSLRALYEEICANTTTVATSGQPGIINERKLVLSSHRYRYRTYNQCFPGSLLVDWLINHNKAKSRVEATALGQALLEAGYLENVLESPASLQTTSTLNSASFSDSPTGFYRPCPPAELTFDLPPLHSSNNSQNGNTKQTNEPAEPTWVQQIPQDGGTTTDSEAESHASPPILSTGTRMPSSSSSFYLDLDLEASTVHLVRPLNSNTADGGTSPTNPTEPSVSSSQDNNNDNKDLPVLQSSVEHEIAPKWGWHNAKQLREEYGEADAYSALNEAWKRHESALLAQFLNNEGLSLQWTSTILSIINEVIDFVRPDMYHDSDIIDIREYVRVKTVPGGNSERNECRVIRGIVCSKNVAHKCMQERRLQPKILLLTCPLVYQRNEGKYMALEPVLLQEHEYLRHATARILAMKPNIVLVARNASRLAQELLGQAGVALVTNVKTAVIDRIARASNAEVVPSIDAANVGRRSWKLATCQEFYTHKFKEDEYSSKTLMFFEGLPASHLACTIILRGASKQELKKLKKVTLKMVFARYNWRLEQSFLMDEFAKPPCPKNDAFFGGSKENSPDNKSDAENNFLNQTMLSIDNKIDTIENMAENENNNIFEDNISITTTSCNSKFEHDCNKDCKEVEISISNANEKNDTKRKLSKTDVFNDPLQYYEDEVFNDTNNTQKLSVTEVPLLNRFRKALDYTILSYSPYLTFTIPFLETEVGRRCKLRKFFPKDIYYSAQFCENDNKVLDHHKVLSVYDKKSTNTQKNLKLKSPHPFITAKLTSNMQNEDIQTMLAHFRACGGRIVYQQRSVNEEISNKLNIATENENICDKQETKQTLIDVLELDNHQRLAVLFCSFSTESNNAPAFCVDPCTKEMHFYGVMDTPLGNFLEQYCFRDSYKCISENCVTSMLKHTRRYVHHNGCITLNLNQLETQISSNTIVMWSWCTRCNSVTPVVPMSTDTWSFSFAKFLELKVHGYMYGRRGKNETCTHSIHHDHVHYFGFGNIVASFHYSSVELLELYLPSPKIEIKYNTANQKDLVIDEVKTLALKGHEVFSAILDKLMKLPNDLSELTDLNQLLQKHQATFKAKIDEVQLKLTSPRFENKLINNTDQDAMDILKTLWHLEDTVVALKRLIVEACEVWNIRLSNVIQTQTKAPKTVPSKQYNKPISIQDLPLNRSNLAAPLGDSESELYSTDVETPSSPDYNVIDVVNATVIEPFEGENVVINESLESSLNALGNSVEETTKGLTKKNRSLDQDEVIEEYTVAEVTTGHTRSHSDSTAGITQQSYDDGSQSDILKDIPIQPEKDKKTVKTLISQFLASPAVATPISCPFSSSEHHLLPSSKEIPIIVYEKEPSSIIAYALATQDYIKALEELSRNKSSRTSLSASQKVEQCPSPINRRRNLTSSDNDNDDPLIPSSDQVVINKQETTVPDAKSKQQINQFSHIDIQFQDNKANFMVRVHYAEQFANLRSIVLGNENTENSTDFKEYEEKYIRSLSRSVQWTARGGKSGSFFCKTKDDRFILKEMSTAEMEKFLIFAPNYFEYMNNCITTSQPTLLGKIIGVYRVCYKNVTDSEKKNFLVMENLFYERRVTHKFDLKGSVRNRHVNIDDQDSEIVLLDENLLKMTCKSPLYIYPHSKSVLTHAIINDTEFLAAQSVMDYSLLVGLDPHTKELVVGIIDYIRTFTWDKKIETIVKKSGLLGGQGKLPTIISPEEYRNRFISAMHRYFLPVPGRWYGLNSK